jgi:hypothetical protein
LRTISISSSSRKGTLTLLLNNAIPAQMSTAGAMSQLNTHLDGAATRGRAAAPGRPTATAD